MKLTAIALSMGIPSNTLDTLVTGKVPDSLSTRLHVRTEALQQFVDGRANSAIALLLSVNLDSAQALRDAIDKEGAIGLLIGIALRRAHQ